MFTYPLHGSAHLRLLEDGDADELFEVVEANRELLSRWMPWAVRQTLAETTAFIQSTREQWARNEGFQAVIIDRQAIVGGIGFGRMDWANRSASLGYWLAETAQGRGLVTAATRALVTHGFRVWELNRLEIRAGTENVRSQRVPERLGFTREGVLREAERFDDRYVDHVLFSMLARDWDG